MNFASVGDISKIFTQRHQNANLQSDLGRLTQEMTSGETSDLSKKLRGDFSSISRISRGLMSASAYQTVITETKLRSDSMQDALGKIQDSASESASSSLTAAVTGQANGLKVASQDTARRLDDVLMTLNFKVADQALFAGVETDSAAISDANTLFAALDPIISGLNTAAEIQSAVRAWIDDPAGFDATMYQGGAARSAQKVSDSQSIPLDITAKDPDIKGLLEGMILGSLVSRGSLAGNVEEQTALTKASAETAYSANADFTALRGGLGAEQARLDEAKAAVSAEVTALQVARNELIGINPYETASKLEATQLQIEMLYTVTARVSRLSLADYLR